MGEEADLPLGEARCPRRGRGASQEGGRVVPTHSHRVAQSSEGLEEEQRQQVGIDDHLGGHGTRYQPGHGTSPGCIDDHLNGYSLGYSLECTEGAALRLSLCGTGHSLGCMEGAALEARLQSGHGYSLGTVTAWVTAWVAACSARRVQP